MSDRGIIILEGADAAGKTTLANVFRERYGARYLHGKLFNDPWRSHLAIARYALKLADTRLVVVDRHWLSHLAYGAVFDNGRYDVAARALDRLWRRAAALTVLCVPHDAERQELDWRAGRGAGKVEHFSSVREVIALYADLAAGNVARPGPGYLAQLTRFGDFAQRDDVLPYDRYRWEGPVRVEKYAARALVYLRHLRQSAYAGGLNSARYNLTGRADFRLDVSDPILFVGEALSPRAGPARWPMTWNDADLSSATWFNKALHALALRENRVVVTNALETDDHLAALLAPRPSGPNYRVVALGESAAQRLRDARYESAARRGYAPHPQWHRRFRYDEGPAGYAKLLAAAVRDAGGTV